jgi:hypothetical protein
MVNLKCPKCGLEITLTSVTDMKNKTIRILDKIQDVMPNRVEPYKPTCIVCDVEMEAMNSKKASQVVS